MAKFPAAIGEKLKALVGLIKRKKVLSAVTAAVVILAAWFFIFRGSGSAAGEYLVEAAQKGNIINTIAASGTVEPVDTISLSFKNAEIIKSIHVKVGDHVVKGQPLAELDDVNLKASVVQAQASFKSAEAKLQSLKNGPRQEELINAEANLDMARESYNQAKDNLERYKTLQQAGAVSKADFDKANLDYINADGKYRQAQAALKTLQDGSLPEDILSAEAQLESSNAQLQQAQSDLEGANLVSPVDGIVSEVNGAVGQRATANNNNTSGGGFITVISEELQVRAQINEADIGRTKLGQKVEFTVNSYPDKKFNGTVSSISPQAYTESNVQIYDIIINTEQKYSDLKAGMPANVNIIVDSHENVIAIPKGAVSYAMSYMSKMRASGAGASSRSGSGAEKGSEAKAGNSGMNSSGNINRSAGGSPAELKPGEQRAMVLVLNSGKTPEPRRVVLGLSDMQKYEVVSGLAEGDKVVVGVSGGSVTTQSSSQGSAQRGMMIMGGNRSTGGGGGIRR